ncbi:hypothetical protein AB0G74_11805 [Streptomyces sp. NPDC020875]|uniref:hypothetical protein n=1 Tax=Streptomyces sp. NPDC020875 TaxID=3154898 RepID=UPI00340CA2CD
MGNARLIGLAATLTATAVLLTGCSSGESGNSGNDDKAGPDPGRKPGWTHTDEGKPPAGLAPRTRVDDAEVTGPPLTEERMVSVIPSDTELPGWRRTAAPATTDLAPAARTCKGAAWCTDVLRVTTGFFVHDDAGTLRFSVQAYKTGKAANAAYPQITARTVEAELLPRGVADTALPVRVGDAATARTGTTRLDGPGSVVVSVVGSTVVTFHTGGMKHHAKKYTASELAALGTLIADRSRQAQQGKPLTASLPKNALTYEKRN